MEVSFQNPEYLWLLVAIPILVIVHFYALKYNRGKALKFANFEAIARVTGGEILSKNITVLIMRVFAILFLVLAISGTIVYYKGESTTHDIVLAIDASGSMSATDYEPNRLEAAKKAALTFVEMIKGDVGIGVVSFSGASRVEQKITTDKILVSEAIKNIELQELSGTDIGQAIITSSNLFLNEERPKTIILLTDGQDNVGVTPAEAVKYIKPKIVVHTIGIGTTEGGTLGDVNALLKLDEETLKFIANETGGKYYRAKNVEELKKAYKEIAEIKERRLKKNISLFLSLIAFALLFIEWGLLSTKYKIM